MELGNKIRSLRENRKFKTSIAQAAMKLGISRQHLSNIEKGAKLPSLDLLIKIADYYKLTVDELLRVDSIATVGSIREHRSLYSSRESVFEELPSDLHKALNDLAVTLLDIQNKSRERILGEFILGMLGDIEERLGEDATNELDAALNLFVDTGDDSALRAWFTRYLSFGDDSLPDQ